MRPESQNGGRVAAGAARCAAMIQAVRVLILTGAGEKGICGRGGYQASWRCKTAGQRHRIFAFWAGRFFICWKRWGSLRSARSTVSRWEAAGELALFVHHSNRQQNGEARPTGSETRDRSRLRRIAAAGAAVWQGCGATNFALPAK